MTTIRRAKQMPIRQRTKTIFMVTLLLSGVMSVSVAQAANCPGGGDVTWSQNGHTCSGTVLFILDGETGNVDNETPGYTGTAEYYCNNGFRSLIDSSCAPASPPSTDCPAQTINWSQNGHTCFGSTTLLASEDSGVYNTTTSGYTGSATVGCFEGVLTVYSGTCAPLPSNCASDTVNWTVGGNTCTAAQGPLNHSASGSVVDSTGPATGSATFTCNNGVRTVQGGATCATSPPPCTPVDGACGATGTAMLNGVCTTGAFDGWRVTGGVWVECTNPVVTCPAQTVTWTSASGDSCSADTTVTNAGNLMNLRDSSAPGVGVASFYCSGAGTWSEQPGATCSAAPTCNSPPPPCGNQNTVQD